MKKLLLVMGMLGAGAVTSFASSSVVFGSAGSNTVAVNGTNYLVSPYTGTIDGQSVTLFCDDFTDTAKASYSANLTTVATRSGSNWVGTSETNTRFGSATNGSGYTAGTTLYEELAWLFTQSISATDDTRDVIQEAAWKLTSPSGSTYTNPTAVNNWITLAQANYLSTNASYVTPDYSKWVIVTDTLAAGHPTGSGGQEFLAYYNTVGGIPVSSGVPEPATFALAGAAFLALGFMRRKREPKN